MIALLIGHDAVYTGQHGAGPALDAAMSALGHDGWWGGFTALAIVAAAALTLVSVVRIRMLGRRIGATGSDAPIGPLTGDVPAAASYRRELMGLWPRLLVTVVVLFTLQENIETLLNHGIVPGIDVLFAGSLPLAIPVLAVATFALAAVGALVRWRIASLQVRLLAIRAALRRALRHQGPASEWAAIAAAAPHRWILDRQDAGRAPPVTLRA